MDDGRWTMDYGPFHGHAINNFVLALSLLRKDFLTIIRYHVRWLLTGNRKQKHTVNARISAQLQAEPTILLACGRDRELWFGPTAEVRDSRTSRQTEQI